MEEGLKKGLASSANTKYPNYIADKEQFARFLVEFRDPQSNAATYMDLASAVAHRRTTVFELALDDVLRFGLHAMAERISMNLLGYREEFSKVIDDFLPNVAVPPEQQDAIDHIAAEARLAGNPLPSQLTRRYEFVISPLADYAAPMSLRNLRASMIGRLTVIRGICIAATTVRPKLQMLTSVCEGCAEATFQTIVGDRLTPQLLCQSAQCRSRNAVGRLLPQHKASRFTKYQELRVQELPVDVPKGSIPRTLRVICEGEQTRIATPGQTVRIVGVYAPDPATGQGNEVFRASTMVKTQFRAISVHLQRRSYEESAETMKVQIEDVRRFPDREAVVDKLTRSIAPEIWGLEDVKKALLCLLVGGSASAKGVTIRSDINICIMGDPGVAKSQLLKWIATVAPRSVFTTGKGSSGVGLTAAVTRDANTGETVLEGGALVLSDHGICCIDEFDKMDETDRTSLHEVMEQQSVSIAKAGIITTLNARTSVLAASNPKFGRWRRNATPSENVNLPPALLSRFDLLWLLLDEADRERDAELSMHVTYIHLHGVAPGRADSADPSVAELRSDYFSTEFLRAYIGEARRIDSFIDPVAAKVITEIYIEMRQQRARQSNVVTPRTLLSLIRLSQAIARLRLASRVQEADVREAGRLLDCSKASLQERHDKSFRKVGATDAGIFAAVKELAHGASVVALSDVRAGLLVKGVTEEQLQRCIATYGELGVWTVDAASASIEFAQ